MSKTCNHYELRHCDEEGVSSWFCVEPDCDFEIRPSELLAALSRCILEMAWRPSKDCTPREQDAIKNGELIIAKWEGRVASQSCLQTKDQINGKTAVLRMRNEFLQLVSAYNATGHYKGAMDAQAVAVMLHKFEDDHAIMSIVWPPRVQGEGYDIELVEVD